MQHQQTRVRKLFFFFSVLQPNYYYYTGMFLTRISSAATWEMRCVRVQHGSLCLPAPGSCCVNSTTERKNCLACVKLFQTLQDIRNEKMLGGFQDRRRGDELRHILARPASTFNHLCSIMDASARDFISILISS